MEVSASAKFVFGSPFSDVLSSLATLKRIDSHSAGFSPVTIRWLTEKNRFVNLGLVELDKASCELVLNNNSFGVTNDELREAYEGITGHLKHVYRK